MTEHNGYPKFFWIIITTCIGNFGALVASMVALHDGQTETRVRLDGLANAFSEFKTAPTHMAPETALALAAVNQQLNAHQNKLDETTAELLSLNRVIGRLEEHTRATGYTPSP